MKRATKPPKGEFTVVDISIHALVKRATKNSKDLADTIVISIHALAKRAPNILKKYV